MKNHKFTRAESRLHNVTAVLFVALLVTGVGMICCNFTGNRGELRCTCRQTHQLLSLLLLTVPPLIAAGCNRGIKKKKFSHLIPLHRLDLLWFVEKRGGTKFNSGQKLWANLVVTGILTLGISGAVMWTVHSPILAMVIHIIVTMALLAMLFGHMTMVAIYRRDIFLKKENHNRQ